MLAVSELAANGVVHAGALGTLLIWSDGSSILGEVRTPGRIDDVLAGRRRPDEMSPGGSGLWLVNQVADLVQVRSFGTRAVVRIRIDRARVPERV